MKGSNTDMAKYIDMTNDEARKEYNALLAEYEEIKTKKLSLDMSRGKPNAEQLDLTESLLGVLSKSEQCRAKDGTDCRNYGILFGLPEARQMFAELLDIPAANIILGGNSSLNMMYDTMARAMLYGVYGSETPWCRLPEVKFLCPVPGYDRHFSICESLGIKMINVPMTPTGPDMDMVEKLVAEDESIKGIWCVPKYSNPDGITYSDETVRRFANLKTAAKDFRIFWDNAYAVHDIEDEGDKLLNLFELIKGTENEDKLFMFFSTSKISFPGSGVALMALSDNNREQIKNILTVQTIGPDKINQLRHVWYFKNAEGILDHMKLHARHIRPKFEIVLSSLEKELGDTGIASWVRPKGGYFISLNTADGLAKATYDLAAEAGVTLTKAGSTFPYGVDPSDKNLRLAPTYPSDEELALAIHIVCICVKLSYFRNYMPDACK